MFGSCMRISALCNSCDAASWMMYYSFEFSSSFTLLMEKVSLLKAHHPVIYQGRLNMRAFILSLLLCLCICMLFICMVQCRCLLWSHAADLQHTNTHVLFPRSHCLSRHIRWSCTAPSEGHVWYLPTPLFLFSLLFLYPSPSLLLSNTQQHHLWRRPARCLKAALVLFGRIAPTQAVLWQWSKWPRSLSFLELRSSNTSASSTCSSLERPPRSER